MIRVIIAEDDPMVAEINRRYLAQFDEIGVSGIYGNGLKALEALKRGPVDLALVDITMPGMSGDRLVEECRALGLSTDFIMVTAANDIEHVSRMLRGGVVDYLVKPFTVERFNLAVEKYLQRKALIGSRHDLNQEELDRMVGAGGAAAAEELPKGLQQATMNTLTEALRARSETGHTCESVSRETGLSRVTVRRYLNHLVKEGKAEAKVCYETGGRPSMLYSLKNGE